MSRAFIAAGMIVLSGLCAWRSVRLALFTTPDNAEYHFRLWQQRPNEPAELERAVQLNPRYSEAWIARGLQAEAAGDRCKAEDSLLRAAAIDRLYLPAWTLANFYLRASNQPKFWIWARRAAGIAYDPSALFQLCWRASSDAREIQDRAIPDKAPVRRAYLDFLLRSNRLEAAKPLAVEIAGTAGAEDLDVLLRYCDAWLARGQADPARRAWNALAVRRVIPYGALDPWMGRSLTNGELSSPPLLRGFDWRPIPAEGATLSFDASARALEVAFSGRQAESLTVMEQYIPVLPDAKYRLRYRYRTRDLAAASGLGWNFVDPRTAAEIAAVDVSSSPDEWGEQTLTFSTPKSCDLLRIVLRYRRLPGRMRAEGSAVFSGVWLESNRS